MSDPTQPRAVLWLPDPSAPAGWGRKAVWSEPERKPTRREMGFHAEVERVRHRDDEGDED